MTLLFGMGFGIIALAPLNLHAGTAFSASYQFDNVTTSSGTADPTPPPTAPGVILGSFRAVGYAGHSTLSGKFSWRYNEPGGIDGDDNFADFTGRLNEGRYFEVTLAPEDPHTLNLGTISFAVRRSATGIRSYAVRSSLDDFAANLPAVIDPANTNLAVAPDNSFQWLFDATTATTDLSGSKIVLGDAFGALTAPVAFRFYSWNAESGFGTFCIDNVRFNGSSEMMPEPGTGAWLAFGAVFFGLPRCRGLMLRRRMKS